MTHEQWLTDRLDVLHEIDAIAREIDRVECCFGAHALITAARHQQERLRSVVLEQLARLTPDLETRH